MNKKDLIEIVRTIVREEVDRALPQLLMEVLAEKIVNKPVVTEEQQPAASPTLPRRKAQVGVEAPLKMPPVKAPKVYTTNPILNQILNETSGGIPHGTDELSLIAEAESHPVPGMGATVHDVIRQASPEQLAENPAVASVANALTRDYSKLLKAVDAKAKASRPA